MKGAGDRFLADFRDLIGFTNMVRRRTRVVCVLSQELFRKRKKRNRGQCYHSNSEQIFHSIQFNFTDDVSNPALSATIILLPLAFREQCGDIPGQVLGQQRSGLAFRTGQVRTNTDEGITMNGLIEQKLARRAFARRNLGCQS